MEDPVRIFTPAEAQAAIPRLKPLLASLRDAFHEYRFAKEQADELQSHHPPQALADPAHPDHHEHAHWRARADDHARRVETLVKQITDLGADVKDPLLGLVDFYARRQDGTLVLLCYRDDEPTLAWWHPLTTGFAGRRPLSEL